jgi:hypothetical protein
MRSLIVCAGVLASTPAVAGYESAYTDFDLKTCTRLSPQSAEGEEDFSGAFECAGYGKFVVTFAEDDLRSFVSIGTESGDHCAFRQTFGGFNSVSKKIEWRLKNGKPIATIFRWTVSYDPEDSSKTKSWLVVTKLEADDSCHMGYVEGGYPKANEKARWLADTAAEAFSCKVGKTIFFASPGTQTDGIAADGGCGQ